MRRTCDLQGLCHPTPEEQVGFARRDFQAISDAVANRRYIAGARLTAFDFAVTGLLSGLIAKKPATWTSKLSEEQPELTCDANRGQDEIGIYACEK